MGSKTLLFLSMISECLESNEVVPSYPPELIFYILLHIAMSSLLKMASMRFVVTTLGVLPVMPLSITFFPFSSM
jgi:hypothetical protein